MNGSSRTHHLELQESGACQIHQSGIKMDTTMCLWTTNADDQKQVKIGANQTPGHTIASLIKTPFNNLSRTSNDWAYMYADSFQWVVRPPPKTQQQSAQYRFSRLSQGCIRRVFPRTCVSDNVLWTDVSWLTIPSIVDSKPWRPKRNPWTVSTAGQMRYTDVHKHCIPCNTSPCQVKETHPNSHTTLLVKLCRSLLRQQLLKQRLCHVPWHSRQQVCIHDLFLRRTSHNDQGWDTWPALFSLQWCKSSVMFGIKVCAWPASKGGACSSQTVCLKRKATLHNILSDS